MKWANQLGNRIEAEPKIDNATCPLCKEKVIPKCGEIKIWHWAHKSLKDCDTWYEPESEWHLEWKNNFPKECQEVIIDNHRADVKIKEKVIELQNSSISKKKIREREIFYGDMLWIINGEKFDKNLILFDKNNKDYLTFRWKNPPKSWWDARKPIYVDMSYKSDRIKNEIKLYESGKKHYSPICETYYSPVHDMEFEKIIDYIDDTENHIKLLNKRLELFSKEYLFLIRTIYKKIPCAGWGILIEKKRFIEVMHENS